MVSPSDLSGNQRWHWEILFFNDGLMFKQIDHGWFFAMFDQRAIISENEQHGGFVFFEKRKGPDRARPRLLTIHPSPKKGWGFPGPPGNGTNRATNKNYFA